MMAVLSSLFQKHKCSRVYGKEQKFCVYFGDILLCFLIILLLIPQILVVRLVVSSLVLLPPPDKPKLEVHGA